MHRHRTALTRSKSMRPWCRGALGGALRAALWAMAGGFAASGILAAPMAFGAAHTPPWPPSEPVAIVDRAAASSTPPSVAIEERSDGRWGVRFMLSLDRAPKRVTIAGTFNSWSRDALPMARGADGVWTAATVIAPGTWEYKFVLDGRDWLADPRNPDRVDDRNGGFNSLLRLGALANLSPEGARAGDGRIESAALGHTSGRALFLTDAANGDIVVRYRTLAGDTERVDLLIRGREAIAMRPALRNAMFQFWETQLPIRSPRATGQDETIEYTFRVHDGATVVRDPEIYVLDPAERGAALRTPEWAKRAIWYQIFPERFRNGRASNDVDGVLPWTWEWNERTEAEKAKSPNFHDTVFERRFGGDIEGIRQKLPYLKELGVNALYLTPVFQSPSLHRYDATSYIHIDEHLGTKGDYAPAEAKEDLLDSSTWTWTESDREFLAFVKEAKSMGFRVIIDGVFNHVGILFPAYRDVLAKGRESRFADWFAVKSWDPVEIEGWAGFGAMPVFRKDEQGIASREVVEHLFAITRRWMDPDGDGNPADGIDGWRLDVPNEIPLGFWREWRKLVKSINPDAYIVGEIWRRADEWLDGTAFDAVMNYPFAEAAIAWVANREKRNGASELDRRLAELRMAYPSEATYVLQNLLDSHDTDRVASMMINVDREYNQENRPQDGATKYITTKPPAWAYERVRLLTLLQMTYVGAPMVWYGDEVGMWGPSDPSNRKPMLWRDLEPYARPEENHVDDAHLAWYRDVIALRKAFPALSVGHFRSVLTDDVQQVWVFERAIEPQNDIPGERIVIALNAGEDEATIRLPLEGQWREVFASNGSPRLDPEGRSPGDRFPKVTLPAIGGRVWRRVEP
jgi:cyclomaltodextrinase / maltogenic alpha-amylase / neopullulanase